MIIAPPYEEPCPTCALLQKEIERMQLVMRMQDIRLNRLQGMPLAHAVHVDGDMQRVFGSARG